MSTEIIDKYNSKLLSKLSFYLNFRADFIKEDMMDELVNQCNLRKEEAFGILLAEGCGLDIANNSEDMEIYTKYFPDMIKELNIDQYKSNEYYKNIKIDEIKSHRWRFKQERYKPFEAFVFNDLEIMSDGRIIPKIGFFQCEFSYPAVLENNREWMLITPNEIETMKEAINMAKGDVLTYGLGLGYFAYMVSIKENVASVTIVERDKEVIELFKNHILPQYKQSNKIKIIQDDAFNFAEKHMEKGNYDFVFTDLWHDPSDGIDMYLKMKKYEKFSPESKYMYWIEKTILAYC